MSESRPPLKLKLTSSQRPPTDAPETPSTSATKLKLKLKPPPQAQSQDAVTQSTPAPKAKAPRKTQSGRTARASKPTSKKRALEASTMSEDEEDFEEEEMPPMKKRTTIKLVSKAAKAAVVAPLAGPVTPAGPNKIRLNVNRTKGLKLRSHKPLGEGYDSCASDAEEDPNIEEDFILRMQPGEDCDYLRQAIAEQRFGPKSLGGADVRMTMLSADGRKACVNIRGTLYAAAMVDLPCIVEGMKSWEKKTWYKSVDICQMLLVLGRIKSEAEAMNFALPREVDRQTMQYPHGLTAPMHHVRTRRFRKRVNRTAIERVENHVEELLRRDAQALTTNYEVVDENVLKAESQARSQSEATQGTMGNSEQDGEGDEDDGVDYTENVQLEEDDDAALAADLEEALAEEANLQMQDSSILTPALLETSSTGVSAPSPASMTAETPAATTPSKDATSGDESSDGDADSNEDIDEDALENERELQARRDEVAELENTIKQLEGEYLRVNAILKRRVMERIQKAKAELTIKKAALGEVEEE